ncbi:MAG: hypothetical protein EOP83_05035 [Verrucomicrobiaceae bacterium]|nr:MAG: hypothetical protein EOP83_05035 [Verrucomicrobiaceae bacterium]
MEELTPHEERPLRLSDLRFALAANGAIQLLLMAFTSLAFDGGYSSRICFQAITGYWLTVGWLAHRRREKLTTVDASLIRIGFVLWLPTAVTVNGILSELFFNGI